MVKIETRCRNPIWRTFERIPWHVERRLSYRLRYTCYYFYETETDGILLLLLLLSLEAPIDLYNFGILTGKKKSLNK